MSLVDDVLNELIGKRRRGYGIYFTGGDDAEKISRGVLRVTLWRLRKRGYVINEKKGVWKITDAGKEYLLKKLPRTRRADKKSPANAKNLIIVFDIPESKRKMRDWLRIELISFGFEMLQKSVWFGPGPLPEKFIRTLGEWNITPYVKFFSAEVADII
ncbi:MAG: CRISPR-associated endonuclease Cas2 [Patescibacteria group bacterium]